MNIFRVHDDPVIAAQFLCDKHICKLAVESAQMLSTAHRILDGVCGIKSNGTPSNQWHLSDERENILYKSTHVSHPSTVWTAESSANYIWHYSHFVALCDEYTFRYGKIHATDRKLRDALSRSPANISDGPETEFRLAMNANPECKIPNDPVRSYRAFYLTKKSKFKMTWTHRSIPDWFVG